MSNLYDTQYIIDIISIPDYLTNYAVNNRSLERL